MCIYFLFKVSIFSFSQGGLQAQFEMCALGASHATLSHKRFVFCRPSVLCSIGAQMIFLMESRRQGTWQFLDASLHGTFWAELNFTILWLCLDRSVNQVCPCLQNSVSAPCTVELHWQVLQWGFKILFRTLMDAKNRCCSCQFFSSLSGSHLKMYFYYWKKKK